MNVTFLAIFLIICCIQVLRCNGAPQFGAAPRGFSPSLQEPPQPYDFNYKVDNPNTGTLFGQNESSDSQGRVSGGYFVLLPDGRLMNVEYTVDGDSGFVPRITFSPQNAPGLAQRG